MSSAAMSETKSKLHCSAPKAHDAPASSGRTTLYCIIKVPVLAVLAAQTELFSGSVEGQSKVGKISV